jgi:hypothetical protein
MDGSIITMPGRLRNLYHSSTTPKLAAVFQFEFRRGEFTSPKAGGKRLYVKLTDSQTCLILASGYGREYDEGKK